MVLATVPVERSTTCSFRCSASVTYALSPATLTAGPGCCQSSFSCHGEITGIRFVIFPVFWSITASLPSYVSTSPSPWGPRARERNQ